MEPTIIYIIIGIAALVVGIILGKVIFAKNASKAVQEAELQAQKIISEGQLKAETFKKEKELEAKEKFVQMRVDHEREVMQRTQKV
ncbi:MAG: Rnase Y domain-containing protein, partial [Ferruginibacter sp.]